MDDKNGRRSRGPSPNGNISDDSMDSSDSESDGGMRVGDDYQAKIPEYNPDVKADARAEAMLVWAPHPDLTDTKIDEYVLIAKERHGYNMEQALGMLFWHKHNVERALTDLANFTPFPDEWTVEDKVLFEQAFSFHGKSFHRIRQMLPDKSISQLVKYYYSWKKTRSRTSLMDRQARKIITINDSEEESASESEAEHKDSSKDESSKLRPGPASKKKYDLHPRKNKHKKRPPRGMYLTQDDLLALATGPAAQGDALLKQLESELVLLKRNVQNNRQVLSGYRAKAVGGVDTYRPLEAAQKINARWTQDELLLAVQGIRKYGKNFKAIAETLGNKSDSHIRSFFVNYRRRYNLDDVLASYQKEHGGGEGFKPEDFIDLDADEKMETDDIESTKTENSSDSKESSTDVNGQPAAKPAQPSSPSKPAAHSQSKEKSSAPSSDKSSTPNGQTVDGEDK